jgi:hypothetical protein
VSDQHRGLDMLGLFGRLRWGISSMATDLKALFSFFDKVRPVL